MTEAFSFEMKTERRLSRNFMASVMLGPNVLSTWGAPFCFWYRSLHISFNPIEGIILLINQPE